MLVSYIAFLALYQLLATVASLTICEGTLKSPNPIKDNVLVKSNCVLAAGVDGNVNIVRGGSLVTSGIVHITGKMTATGPSVAIDLGNRDDFSDTLPSVRNINVTVVGGLDVLAVDFVNIRPDVSVGPISVGNVKSLTHRGVAKSIVTKFFSTVSIRGGIVEESIEGFGGISLIDACGSKILGGIKFQNVVDGVFVAAPTEFCKISDVRGAITASKSVIFGRVVSEGGPISLDVSDCEGVVDITGARLTKLNIAGLNVSRFRSPPSVKLHSVYAEKGGSIQHVLGDIVMENVISEDEFSFTETGGKISVTSTSFGSAKLQILRGKDSVSIKNVTGVSLVAEGTEASVEVADSTIQDGKFIENAVLKLNGNQFNGVLNCAKNGKVKGNGNSIPENMNPSDQCITIS